MVDNPAMTGSYALSGPQIVQSNANGWVTNFFDLVARRTWNASNQDLSVSTTTLVAQGGGLMNWTARGVRLPPRLTGAANEGVASFQLLVDDATTGPLLAASQSVQLQLDPNVILVPVVVVQLYDNSAVNSTWYPLPKAAELFDNEWQIIRSRTNNPNANPYQVASSWGFRGTGDFGNTTAEPDSIWTQCNIQFRLVRYVACQVTPEQWQNIQTKDATDGYCGGNAQATRAQAGADSPACAKDGLVAGTLRIILSGPYTRAGQGCIDAPAGLTPPGSHMVFVSSDGLATFNVMAHELGHALGLYHDNTPGALMNETAGLTTWVDPTSCSTVRAAALLARANYTGSW